MGKGQGPRHTTKRKRTYMDKAEGDMANTHETKLLGFTTQVGFTASILLLGLKGEKKTHTQNQFHWNQSPQ